MDLNGRYSRRSLLQSLAVSVPVLVTLSAACQSALAPAKPAETKPATS